MPDFLNSFGKINLVLRVSPRQTNGYHLIDSVFQSISLADTLQIEACPKLIDHEITLNNASIPNLNIKALLQHPQLRHLPKMRIVLSKSIPLQAGLGGGSSNIAALISYFKLKNWLNDTLKDLETFSLQYGADVPYFLTGGCCRVTGIGEKVMPITPMYSNTEYLLIFPPFGMGTKTMYQALDDMHAYSDPFTLENNQLSTCCHNDFKPVAWKLYPKLQRLDEIIQHKLGLELYLSGSGSTCFLVVPSKKAKSLAIFVRDLLRRQFEGFLLEHVVSQGPVGSGQTFGAFTD